MYYIYNIYIYMLAQPTCNAYQYTMVPQSVRNMPLMLATRDCCIDTGPSHATSTEVNAILSPSAPSPLSAESSPLLCHRLQHAHAHTPIQCCCRRVVLTARGHLGEQQQQQQAAAEAVGAVAFATHDHSASDPAEMARVEAAGGHVLCKSGIKPHVQVCAHVVVHCCVCFGLSLGRRRLWGLGAGAVQVRHQAARVQVCNCFDE
jgi:hypothetical protein